MRVYLLRTTGTSPSYEAIEARSLGDIQRIVRHAEQPSRAFDPAQDEGRYIHAVMCQGVDLTSFDHYAIWPRGGRLELYAWNDDHEDWPQPWGVVWNFGKPRPDPKVGGRVNTDQRCTVFGNDAWLAGESTSGGPVVHRPWSAWTEPPAGLTMHGVWTDDDTNDKHLRAVARGGAEHGWREWTE